MINTRCPACTRPAVRACSAVPPEIPTTAACSNEAFAGLWASLSSRAAAYSAKEPRLMPNTSSPTANLVTAEPTAATVPATSTPGHPVLRPAEPEPDDPHQVRRARHQVPRPPVQTGRVHPQQHLVVGDLGSVDLRRAQHVGGAVAVLHDRPHHCLPSSPGWCRLTPPACCRIP